MYVLEQCRGLNGEIPLLVMHYRLTSNSNVFCLSTIVENSPNGNFLFAFNFARNSSKLLERTYQITTIFNFLPP